MMIRIFVSILFFSPVFVFCADSAATKGVYKVVNPLTNIPCINFQSDIYLYLTYITNSGEKDVTVHVPTSSSVDNTISSCDTTVSTSGLSVAAQLLRVNLYHMDGWTIDFAFTKNNQFKTDSGKEYALFQVNITANFASDPETFPDPKYPVQNYYLHVDKEELSDIAGSVYATVDNSYYCPSQQKYVVNDDSSYGPSAYIKFKLTTLQAFMTSSSFGSKETCPSDQTSTDLIPIIVGSALAGLIIITLVVYLIYRSFLPEEVLNLVNPESHFNYDNAEKTDESEHV